MIIIIDVFICYIVSCNILIFKKYIIVFSVEIVNLKKLQKSMKMKWKWKERLWCAMMFTETKLKVDEYVIKIINKICMFCYKYNSSYSKHWWARKRVGKCLCDSCSPFWILE